MKSADDVSPFVTIADLAFPRKNKATGAAEQLRIQLVEVDDKHFITMAQFWRGPDGKFYPPSKQIPRLVIRTQEAGEVIRLLQQLIDTD